MVGGELADIGEHGSLCGTHHIHHVLVVAPFLAPAQHLFKEAFALGVGGELEIVAALVAGECQQHYPLVLIAQEGGHAVFAHIGSDGECVNIVFFKEGAGIHGRCIADVASFGIGNDEMVGIVLLEIVDGLLEGHHALDAEGLIEGEVGFVRHAVGGGGVDDGFVESEDGILLVQQVLWNLLGVGVETHTEKTLLEHNLLYQLLSVHDYFLISVLGNSLIWSGFRCDESSRLINSSAGTVRSCRSWFPSFLV